MLAEVSAVSAPLPVRTVSQRINAERVLVLSWPRAILMQIAHPLVAAGVADHSTFRSGPLAAAGRLHETVAAMLRLTFAGEPERTETIDGIRAIHRRVNGHLRTAAGPFAAGTRYSAEDPDLLLWVHVSLVESVLVVHDQLFDPLSTDDRNRYCAEAAPVAVELGAHADAVPTSWDGVTEAVARRLASGDVAVSDDARVLADAILSPPLGAWARPLTRINRRLTLGWLPAELRAGYGWAWTADDDRAHQRVVERLRKVRRRLPSVVAHWPQARRARS